MIGSRRAVIYSGGVGHAFAETSDLLADRAAVAGWEPEIICEFDGVLHALSDATLLIVNALSWSMRQDEKYAPLRAQWGFEIAAEQIARVEHFALEGGAMLAMHTGLICWDEHPRWITMLGGGWRWGASHHPPIGKLTVVLTEAGAKLSRGEARFALVDEAYHGLDPSPDCTVLAVADLGNGALPLAWLRQHGAGRIGVDALGHDVASLRTPGHLALLDAMLNWIGSA